jgi:hypothetical protein
MTKPLVYRSFLLTAWEERHQAAAPERVWRFGLEDVRGTQRRRVFTTLEEVMRYVKEELAETTNKSTLPE